VGRNSVKTEPRKLIFEDFDLWLKTRFTDIFWFRGHKFQKTEGEDVLVDGGLFSKKEVRELFGMLNSRNPFTRFNATILIWERNGFLMKMIISLAFIALILLFIRVRR